MFAKRNGRITRVKGFGIFLNARYICLKGLILRGFTFNGSSRAKMQQITIATNEIETLMIKRNWVYSSPFTVTCFPPNILEMIGAIPL